MKKTILLSMAILIAMPSIAIAPNSEGVYEISNAVQLEEFAAVVNGGNTTAKVVLTADIDMAGVTHIAIGNSKETRYRGEFDGQFHTLSNLIMEDPEGTNLALFGYVGGGAKIRNMVMDGSCKFLGADKCAAFVGQATESEESEVELSCLGNAATVHAFSADGGRAAAIAGPDDEICCYIFKNCYNIGEIRGGIVAAMSCKATYCQMFSCWTTMNVKVQKNAEDAVTDPKNMQRYLFTQYKGSYEDKPWSWNFIFTAEDSGTISFYPGQAAGMKKWTTYKENIPWEDPNGKYITGVYKVYPSWQKNGALCWFLNDCTTVDAVWGQDLGKDDFPTFIPGHGQVDQGADFTFTNTGQIIGTSGVSEISLDSAGPKGIYTIQGVKVKNANIPGIYIIDGKKVVIK